MLPAWPLLAVPLLQLLFDVAQLCSSCGPACCLITEHRGILSYLLLLQCMEKHER
jgi:hypothetical protein